MAEKYDVVVIGGGTGGLRLALRAAGSGLKTAVVDPGVLGGTCLNTGCIPTKALLHAAELYQDILGAPAFGIEIGGVKANFKKIMARMHAIVREGQEHIAGSIRKRGLTVIREKAVFLDAKTVQAGARRLTAGKFVISTGARPLIPAIRGVETTEIMVSDDVLKLETLPASLIIIGGGYIAMELATFFVALGTSVTVIEHGGRILKELDSDITSLLERMYRKRGIRFMMNREVIEVVGSKDEAGVVCSIPGTKPELLKAERILAATGRAPNTEGLGLEKAGVKVNEYGGIVVDETLATSNPAIFAFGDVTGRAPFAHAAKRESYIVMENLLHDTGMRMPFDAVPWAVFCDPPAGGIGIGEEKAWAQGIPYAVQKAEFKRAGRATIVGQTEGFVKLVYERASRRVLGAFVVGPRADDIIHEFVAFMQMKATVEDVHAAIHIHPTLSEVVEALQDVEPLPLQHGWGILEHRGRGAQKKVAAKH